MLVLLGDSALYGGRVDYIQSKIRLGYLERSDATICCFLNERSWRLCRSLDKKTSVKSGTKTKAALGEEQC